MTVTRAFSIAFLTTLAALTHLEVARSESTRRPAVRVETGMVINSRASYYFALPEGWVLDNASDYKDLKVHHPDSGATFSVNYDHARGDANMYYMSLIMALKSPDTPWLSMGSKKGTIGGREAFGIRGTREKDGKRVKELFWASLDGEYVYLIYSSVAEGQFESRRPDIDQMIASFAWGNPKDTQGAK